MKEKQFKPMLAPNEAIDIRDISYPVYVSDKLDGIRCLFINGEMLSRSLKPIRNKQLNKRFEFLKVLSKKHDTIFDGELYLHNHTFQEITSYVSTEDKEPPEELKFYCFDCFNTDISAFQDRVALFNNILSKYKDVVCVEQTEIYYSEDITPMFEYALQNNYEGLILKNPYGHYKFGRATVTQNLMYKVKPFKTYDLKVIGTFERMKNTNDSEINELGNKYKSNTLADKKPTGIAAGFITIYNNKEMKVTLTGNEAFRKNIWDNKNDYVGQTIEVKGMEVGSKDVLRHPTFVRFREDK